MKTQYVGKFEESLIMQRQIIRCPLVVDKTRLSTFLGTLLFPFCLSLIQFSEILNLRLIDYVLVLVCLSFCRQRLPCRVVGEQQRQNPYAA